MKKRFEDWKEPFIDNLGWAYPNGVSNIYHEERYGWKCKYSENLKLGKYTDIGFGTYINAKYGVEIGENTQIGSHCSIYSENTENETYGKVIIGKDCMIGSFCLILPNTVIPDGNKIRAYSIIKGE